MSDRARWLVVAAVAGCGDNLDTGHLPPYFWGGDQHEVGSIEIDNLDASTDGPTLDKMPPASHPGGVLLLYAHVPGQTVTLDTLHTFLAAARDDGLPFLTFHDLATGDRRDGVCLSFDDNSFTEWYGIRDLLASFGAHVTFFVTEYSQATPEQRQMLHELYADGHSVEAHGVNHEHGIAYVAQHGLDAYLADEVIPSIQILRDDGFDPVAFAYPYGERTTEMDGAILDYVDLVRGISNTPLPGRAN